MKKLAVFALGILVAACGETPTESPTMDMPTAMSEVGTEAANPDSKGQIFIADPFDGMFLSTPDGLCIVVDSSSEQEPDTWIRLGPDNFQQMSHQVIQDGSFFVIAPSMGLFGAEGPGHGVGAARFRKDGSFVSATFTLTGKAGGYAVTCRVTANKQGVQESFITVEPLG